MNCGLNRLYGLLHVFSLLDASFKLVVSKKSAELFAQEFIVHSIFPTRDFGRMTGPNKIIDSSEEVGQIAGKIECRERLGGMLQYYYRKAV